MNARLRKLKRQLEKEEIKKGKSEHDPGKPDECPKRDSQFVDDFQKILAYCYKTTSVMNKHLRVDTQTKDGNIDKW